MSDKATHKNRRSPWRDALRKVSVFVRRIRRNEILTFLGFLLTAFFFWVMATAYQETDSTLTVRLVVTEQPENCVFTTHIPKEIRVSIRDKNYQMLRYYYAGILRQLNVDFNRYADLSGNFRISAAELDALVKAELQPTTQITAILPSLIDARYAAYEGRRIPVNLDLDYLPAADHRCGKPVFSPDTVLVHAPSAILDTLTAVQTVPLSYLALTDTLSRTVALNLPLGVNATPDSVRLMIPVSQYVGQSFPNVAIRTDYVPDNVRLNLFPYAVQVSCLVDFNYYRDLRPDDFQVSVSYLDIGHRQQKKLPLHLRYNNHEGRIANVRLHPDSVEYVVETLNF